MCTAEGSDDGRPDGFRDLSYVPRQVWLQALCLRECGRLRDMRAQWNVTWQHKEGGKLQEEARWFGFRLEEGLSR